MRETEVRWRRYGGRKGGARLGELGFPSVLFPAFLFFFFCSSSSHLLRSLLLFLVPFKGERRTWYRNGTGTNPIIGSVKLPKRPFV